MSAPISVIKALTGYFNTGEAKRAIRDWNMELKALTTNEKRELAELVVIETGDTLMTATVK